ncbi:ABC transporter substrate-binding protein [Halopiger djelfimassiliensis]|uniref:ABC transporter substrate-binding protein n=1 Tax=Halopiger djelfimassiliensis TaxID=1293047 RepID=UPI000677EA1D|nr:extracellular solute-binding protein [Halopiger djelfimassiliensis]
MAADPERVAETSGCESKYESSTDATSGSLSRRDVLSATAAGSMATVAGCAKIFGSDTATEGETLDVCVWSGNYADRFEESVVPMYEEKTGKSIRLHRGWNEILADIRQAPDDEPPYDVTVTEGQFYHIGRQEELFLPIREENVPNLEAVIDYYTEFRTTEYGMPVDGAPCTIVYREDMDIEPDSWADFDSDAVRNSSGIGVDTGFWWFPVHAAAIGMDDREFAGELYESELHDDVFETFRNWNVSGWASSGEDIWQDFQNDVIDVAQWYFEQTEFDIDDYDGLAHTTPEHNTGYLNHWCVVDGTDKRAQAEDFLNFLMDAEVQTEWSEHMPTLFTNENMSYADDLGEELPTNSEEAENIAFPDWGYLMEYYEELNQTYTDIQTDA